MQEQPKPQVQHLNADDFGAYDGNMPGLVILQISKDHAIACKVASALERVRLMAATPDRIRELRGKVTFVVTGYDADSRELYEIAPVRTFFRALTKEWPYWLWFLEADTGIIPTLFALLCDVKIVRQRGMIGTAFSSPSKAFAMMRALANETSTLAAGAGVDAEDISEVLNAACQQVFACDLDELPH